MKFIYNHFEKMLILLSILSLILLLAVQFINYNNDYTIFTSMNNEGNRPFPFSNSIDSYEKGTIILKNLEPNCSNVGVLVNGEHAGDFINNDEVKIYVYNNDMVEIDGTRYNNNVKIKVVGISSNLEEPKLDTIVTTSQSIEILSKVQLK